jgi:hypothetical protein
MESNFFIYYHSTALDSPTNFSQRHILVKGCGKDGDSDSTNHNPDLKGEGHSEDGSPILNGRV